MTETAAPRRMGAALTYARLVGIAEEDAPDLLAETAPAVPANQSRRRDWATERQPNKVLGVEASPPFATNSWARSIS